MTDRIRPLGESLVPDLIYCAAGNVRFAKIALEHGFKYGAQIPNTVYYDLFFADQDWRNPKRAAYIQAVKAHQPYLATVLDWERDEQLNDVLAWAEDVASYVETVIIIPKVMGGIDRVPQFIGGKPVRLGYSVPTSYGGTSLPVWEFGRRSVHLLGGSPQKQIELSYYLNVQSVDGNYAQKMAVRYCQFFSERPVWRAKNKHWPQLQEVGDGYISQDAPYEAFARSCENIARMWRF